MWLPVLDYEDGYGSRTGLASVSSTWWQGQPDFRSLTWGGERRASMEFEQTFQRGPFTRLEASAGVWRRENPAYEVGDLREEFTARLERAMTPWLRVGGHGGVADVAFGDSRDQAALAGLDIVADTRADPAFPRNAVLCVFAWDASGFQTAPDTFRTRRMSAVSRLVGRRCCRARAARVGGGRPAAVRTVAPRRTASMRGFAWGFVTAIGSPRDPPNCACDLVAAQRRRAVRLCSPMPEPRTPLTSRSTGAVRPGFGRVLHERV